LSASSQPTLLLTGATGLVGGELLQHLLAAQPDRLIVALVRPERTAALRPDPRVRPLAGDLTLPRLGISAPDHDKLTESLTEIVHCAAETRFGLPLHQARATNTQGTEALLDLARGCRRLRKFAHLSTVYVAGRSVGRLPEAPVSHRNGFCNTYQQTKYEAEQLVVRAMGELPAAVFRLSAIIGDSRTGRVRQFNYVHQLWRVFPRNVLPVAPAEPSAHIDLIASDWAVSSLAYLFEKHFAPGRIYNLCAGPEASLTVRQLIDLTMEQFESHPLARRWLPIRTPRLVSLSEFEDFVEQSRRGSNSLLNELLRVLSYFLPHLGLFQAFENRRTREALEAGGIRLPPIRTYYGKVIQYCLETDWGRRVPRGLTA